MFEIAAPQLNQASLCEPILRLLPEWFGIESAIVHYVQEIDRLPALLAWSYRQIIGFLTVKQHNEFATEIYVMAVHPQFHHQGVGRQLVEAAEKELRKLGVEFFQVKTLGVSSPDPYYARARKFYEAAGFKPLEEFLNFWEGNPCLQMVKRLPPG